jgi:hypothetical protein
MGASAVFVDRSEHGRRITAIVEELSCLELVQGALLDAGFHLESVDAGVDTTWDIAATGPDLLVITITSEAGASGLASRVAALRAHPRLEVVPVVLCAPDDLQPIAISPEERVSLGIVDATGTSDQLRELAARLPEAFR